MSFLAFISPFHMGDGRPLQDVPFDFLWGWNENADNIYTQSHIKDIEELKNTGNKYWQKSASCEFRRPW